tara:strand:+ start:77947 stop:78978 length:1032 start_codon:yes stop_codon:yes gene_type:complete
MSVKHEKINQVDIVSSAEDSETQVNSRQMDELDRTELGMQEDARFSSRQQLIPPHCKMLFVNDRRPDWVGLALRLDSMSCPEPRFEWVSTSEEALTLLRNDNYDCLLIGVESETKSTQLELLNAIRVSGCHDPVVLVLAAPDDQVVLAGCEYQAEVLISTAMWESPALLSTMKRAMLIHKLSEDNHRLLVENHRRLIRERDEAERLLKQQRSMVEELQTLAYPDEFEESASDLMLDRSPNRNDSRLTNQEYQIPLEVQDYYHELLRTYVIMGSGSLKEEILQIAELLAAANLTPGQVLEFHLECVEVIVRGLGNRSSRHVMSRADLLALEIMVHLGECYLKRT